MCGRFTLVTTPKGIAAELRAKIDADADSWLPTYNVAPNQQIWSVLAPPEAHERVLRQVRWGLVPSWSKEPKSAFSMINARAETVTEKPSFRTAASKRRCIIPASGYYEWMPVAGGKQPYYLHPQDDEVLAFAGLYEQWWPKNEPDAEPLWTGTIITTTAPDALGQIHDRTPLILPKSMWEDWLSPDITDRADVQGMIAAVPEPRLIPRLVGKAVGNVRSQGPQLIEAVEV